MPQPLRVEMGEGDLPGAIWGSSSLEVTAIRDQWRIDDEWWRQHPISRCYFQLILTDGRCATVFKDLLKEEWWRQSY